MVQPRLTAKKDLDDLHILFCHEGTIKPGETFQPNHFVPLLFHPHQHKRKSAAASQASTASKKQKLCPILPRRASKKPDTSITQFFNVAEKPVVNPTSHKAHDESFSSATALGIHKLDQLSKLSTSTNTQQSTILHSETDTGKISIGEKVKLNFK